MDFVNQIVGTPMKLMLRFIKVIFTAMEMVEGFKFLLVDEHMVKWCENRKLAKNGNSLRKHSLKFNY